MNIVEKYGGTSVADLDKIRAIACQRNERGWSQCDSGS